MSELTKRVKNCGIHDCNHKCYAISESEARQVITLIKSEIIMVINNIGLSADDNAAVIQAIKDVK